MTRCEDCLHFEVCDALERCNGVPKISSYGCGCYENTTSIQKAKQEVAREMFEEIEDNSIIQCLFNSKPMVTINLDTYTKLKKKYTESEGKG